MKIVALDLGKNKTVVCFYDGVSAKQVRQQVRTALKTLGLDLS